MDLPTRELRDRVLRELEDIVSERNGSLYDEGVNEEIVDLVLSYAKEAKYAQEREQALRAAVFRYRDARLAGETNTDHFRSDTQGRDAAIEAEASVEKSFQAVLDALQLRFAPLAQEPDIK